MTSVKKTPCRRARPPLRYATKYFPLSGEILERAQNPAPAIMEGRVSVKIVLGSDIRRVSFPQTHDARGPTFKQLKGLVERCFASVCGKLWWVAFQDDENERIRIGSDEELIEALATAVEMGVKLKLFVRLVDKYDGKQSVVGLPDHHKTHDSIPMICKQLDATNCLRVLEALRSLEAILRKEDPSKVSKLAVEAVDECGGLDQLERLQSHENPEIYANAMRIISTFFEGESDVAESEERIVCPDMLAQNPLLKSKSPSSLEPIRPLHEGKNAAPPSGASSSQSQALKNQVVLVSPAYTALLGLLGSKNTDVRRETLVALNGIVGEMTGSGAKNVQSLLDAKLIDKVIRMFRNDIYKVRVEAVSVLATATRVGTRNHIDHIASKDVLSSLCKFFGEKRVDPIRLIDGLSILDAILHSESRGKGKEACLRAELTANHCGARYLLRFLHHTSVNVRTTARRILSRHFPDVQKAHSDRLFPKNETKKELVKRVDLSSGQRSIASHAHVASLGTDAGFIDTRFHFLWSRKRRCLRVPSTNVLDY